MRSRELFIKTDRVERLAYEDGLPICREGGLGYILSEATGRFLGHEGGISITEYTYSAQRMGLPQITASVMHERCLDKEWNGDEYVVFRGEKYFLRDTPSSSKSNTDLRYKHDLVFKSEREILAGVYFYDVVPSWSATADKPCSNSTEFVFYGTPAEFVDRLNCSLRYAGIGDSILDKKTTLTPADKPVGDGYCAILDPNGGYDLEQTKEFNISDQYIWDVLADAFNLYEIPFEFHGKTIVFGAKDSIIPHAFQYGHDNELLAVNKNNANARIINRVTFKGSAENIPYYYPNESEYGHISLKASPGNKLLTLGKARVNSMTQMLAYAKPDTPIVYCKGSQGFDNAVTITSLQYGHMGLTVQEWHSYSYNQWVETKTTETTIRATLDVKVQDGVVLSSIVGGLWMANTSSPGGYSDLMTNRKVFTGITLYRVSDGKAMDVSVRKDGKYFLGELPVGQYYLDIHLLTHHPTDGDVKQLAIGMIHFEAEISDRFYWKCGDVEKSTLGEFGILYDGEITASAVGDSFYWTAAERMPFQKNLVPPKYIETSGMERFYDAINDFYLKEDGTYYHFNNPLRNPGLSDKLSLSLGNMQRVIKAGTTISDSQSSVGFFAAFDTSLNMVSGYYPNGYLFEDNLRFKSYVQVRSTEPTLAYPYGQQLTDYPGTTSVIVKVREPIILYVHARIGQNKALRLYDRQANEITGTESYSETDSVSTSNRFVTVKWELDSGEYTLTELGGTGQFCGYSYARKSGGSELLTFPSEYIYVNEDIKPTIEGIRNGRGQLFGEIASIAYDASDNDSLKPDTEDSQKNDSQSYEHSFFYIKLRLFDGPDGFDLFKHATQSGPMTIQMTSGSCNGCKFKIQAVQREVNGAYEYLNPVQASESEAIAAGDYADKVREDNIQPWQQNTQTNSIWICVQKDAGTFGVIMPNRSHNYMPKAGDTFNITDIDLPESYKRAAENKGMHEALQEMEDNNDEKFTFDITASRIFFGENEAVLDAISEHSVFQIVYNGDTCMQYVSGLEISFKTNEPLPDVKITLVDKITAGQSYEQQILSKVDGMFQGEIADGTIVQPSGAEQGMTPSNADGRYLRRDVDERTEHSFATDKAIEVGEFVSGMTGGIFDVDPETGKTRIEVDMLRVRMKAIFEALEVVKVNTIGGKQIITPGGGMTISFVAQTSDTYRCYFKREEGDEAINSRFVVGDMAYCQAFNLDTPGTRISLRRYWRKVVAVNNKESYIDLSKTDREIYGNLIEVDSVPAAGDVICQLGNKDNPSRQSAIVLSTTDDNAPCVTLYHGINSYSLDGREYVAYGVDKSNASKPRAFFNVYGDAYIGNRDGSAYMKYTPEGGLEVKGKISSQSTIDDKNIGDYISDAVGAEVPLTVVLSEENIAFECSALPDATFIGYSKYVYYKVYKGAEEIKQDVNWDFICEEDDNGNYLFDWEIVHSLNQIELMDIFADTAKMTIRATVDGQTAEAVVQGFKVAGGEAAKWWTIMPSVSSIVKTQSGKYSEDTLECTVYQHVGGESPVPSNYGRLVYQALPDETEYELSRTNGVSEWVQIDDYTEFIVFSLYHPDTGQLLDRERVPILLDAAGISGGGVNLLRNSAFQDASLWELSDHTVIDAGRKLDGCNSVRIMREGAATTEKNGFSQTHTANPLLSATPRGSLAVSVWIYAESSQTGSVEISFYDVGGTMVHNTSLVFSMNKYGEWIHMQRLIEVPTLAVAFDFSCEMQGNGKLWFAKPQVEDGTLFTDWKPNPEDFSYITEALRNSGSIEGGLILGSMIQLGYDNENGNKVVTAGMNGLLKEGYNRRDLAFWAGGGPDDAALPNVVNGATFAIRHDGSAYAANNTVRFEQNQVEVGDGVYLSKDGLRLQDKDGVKVLISQKDVVADMDAFSQTTTPYSQTFSGQFILAVLGFKTFVVSSPANKTIPIGQLSGGQQLTIGITASMTHSYETNADFGGTPLYSLMSVAVLKDGVSVASYEVPAVSETNPGPVVDNYIRKYEVDYAQAYSIPTGADGNYSLLITFAPAESTPSSLLRQRCSLSGSAQGDSRSFGSGQTLLGRNGFSSAWKSSAFAIDDNAIILKVGLNGIRLTESGIEMTADGGTTWIPM